MKFNQKIGPPMFKQTFVDWPMNARKLAINFIYEKKKKYNTWL